MRALIVALEVLAMLRSSLRWLRFSHESLGLAVLSLVIYGSLSALMALGLLAKPFPWTAERWLACSLAIAAGAGLSFVLARRLCWGSRPSLQTKDGETRLQRQFVALAEGSLDAVFVLEARSCDDAGVADFTFRFLNAKASAMLGQNAGNAVGSRVEVLLPFLEAEGFLEQFREVVAKGTPVVGEVAVRDEQIQASWIRLSVVRFEQGVLLTVADLSKQKALESQLCQGVQRDKLTGLPNRTLLDDRIQQALERAKRTRSLAAVMMLEVGSLREINKEHGTIAGDQVLKVVAARLRRSIRASDSAFRLSGDQFVVLFSDITGTGLVKDLARGISHSLQPAIVWKGKHLQVNASVGLAMYPAAGTTPETLLVEADIDMARAKRCQRAQAGMETRAAGMVLQQFSLMMP